MPCLMSDRITVLFFHTFSMAHEKCTNRTVCFTHLKNFLKKVSIEIALDDRYFRSII